MAFPNPLVNINGVSLDASEVTSYKLQYAKLWKDAGRDMSGVLGATLIGVYPNIEIDTDLLDFSEAMALSAAINVDYFPVTYWDTQTNSHQTAQYYAADHDVTFVNACKYGSVKIQLVPVRKAPYI